jgi:hypothetical protein
MELASHRVSASSEISARAEAFCLAAMRTRLVMDPSRSMFLNMENDVSRNREKFSPSQGKKMNAVIEARSILRMVPRGPDESKGAWLRKAAEMFGLTPSQAKKIEYDEVKDLRASRLDAMREIQQGLKEAASRRREMLDGLQARLTELRSNQGRGNTAGDCDGAASAGGGSDGAGEGGLCPDRPADALIP